MNLAFNSENQQVQGFVNENSNVPKNYEIKFLKMLTASETSEVKLSWKRIVLGRTMFEVQCLIVQSQKMCVWVQLPKDEHVLVRSMLEKPMFNSVQ